MLSILELIQNLDGFIDELIALHKVQSANFNTSAMFAADQSIAKFHNRLDILNNQFQYLRESAVDHATGVYAVLKNGETTFVQFTCLRSVVETCAIINWLVDTNITTLERVRRSLQLDFHEINEYIKLFTEAREPADNQKLNERRRIELINESKSLGIAIDKPNQFHLLTTNLVRDHLNMAAEYRFLCGFTHSSSLVGRHTFKPLSDNKKNGYISGTREITPQLTQYIFKIIIKSLGQMSLNTFMYFMGDDTKVKELLGKY